MNLLIQYWPLLLNGFLVTARVCLVSIIFAVILGLVIAIIRQTKVKGVAFVCTCYIELFRGTPILIQLFLLYYVGPNFGIMLDAEQAGITGLSLYGAAYYAEIFRGGFESIPKGQLEAASCLGMRKTRVLSKVIMPQLAALIMPPSINQSITLIKDSAVLSIITVPELTKVTSRIINESFASTEPLLILAILYLILVEAFSLVGSGMEKRFTRYMRATDNVSE